PYSAKVQPSIGGTRPAREPLPRASELPKPTDGARPATDEQPAATPRWHATPVEADASPTSPGRSRQRSRSTPPTSAATTPPPTGAGRCPPHPRRANRTAIPRVPAPGDKARRAGPPTPPA